MKSLFDKQRLPFIGTILVGLVLYLAAGARFHTFFSGNVICDFFKNDPAVGIAGVGLTFVIISGGIDLSVGAMIGCVSVIIATFVEKYHFHPLLVMPAVLIMGTLFGAGMGSLIRFFGLPPFLVTLGGLFFCRGLGLIISKASQIDITHPICRQLSLFKVAVPKNMEHTFGKWSLSLPALMLIGMVVIGVIVSIYTRFGRNAYALGGNEQSAKLMGLPVGSTKIWIYAFSGFCSALAGIASTFVVLSGDPLRGTGLELDAIAAVVVGGTLLSGGVGYVAGTLVGVLIFGIIQEAITFDGTLSSWWQKIAIGFLLLVFILLQKFIQRRAA